MDRNNFVFKCGVSEDVWKRSKTLAARINRRIRNSKVLQKKSGYIYTSHMLRKSVAMMAYLKNNENAEESARREINQGQGSKAIKPNITV